MEKNFDNFFESASGFSMPFLADEDHDVQVLLDYGDQIHPQTGNPFHHNGVDLLSKHKDLLACATGMVISIATDPVHEQSIIIRHGMYDVKYGHVQDVQVSYGSQVTAGQVIGKSGEFLHFEVRCNGQNINPIDFLAMIYNNIMLLAQMGIKGTPQLTSFNVPIKTEFDNDQDEILQLLMRWMPSYIEALSNGTYRPSSEIEAQLRSTFNQAAEKNYFFEVPPSPVNPLGISSRGGVLASKVQNLLVKDFLGYLAANQSIYLSSWTEEQKKNFMKPQTASPLSILLT